MNIAYAEVAELADALDSKSSVVALRAGSSPAFGTRKSNLSRVNLERFFYFSFVSQSFKPLTGRKIDYGDLGRMNANNTAQHCLGSDVSFYKRIVSDWYKLETILFEQELSRMNA